jgi:hypothetical protein
VGLKLNGTRQLLAYADDVNLLGDNIDTVKKNMETVIDDSKEFCLEINVDKTEYMMLSRLQNVGQNRRKTNSKQMIRKCVTVQIFGATVTNPNLIQEEIKRRLNSGNACYHSVQNILSSRLLSKSVKIRIYKTTNMPVVLYGCETWSLTLREKHRLRVGTVNLLSQLSINVLFITLHKSLHVSAHIRAIIRCIQY